MRRLFAEFAVLILAVLAVNGAAKLLAIEPAHMAAWVAFAVALTTAMEPPRECNP